MAGHYRPLEALLNCALDLVIVTGADPGEAANLRDMVLWPSLERLMQWTVERRQPAIWSCLAAHAAVDHLDGVQRRRLPQKYSGVFACGPGDDHPLLAGLGSRWFVPHSRHNDLDEAELVSRGYRILSRSDLIGADSFVREGLPFFLFCQGHPEYHPDSLALEFKRDFRAYLHGEHRQAPAIPPGAFQPEAERRLAALREEALSNPSPDLMARWPELEGPITPRKPVWRDFGVGLYRAWLGAVRRVC
jgi:homoserine O-succinyltransferase